MAIYWMRTEDHERDGSWLDDDFVAFDDEARDRFGERNIGRVYRIERGPEAGLWQWSMTASLPGPMFRGTNDVVATRSEAGRRVVETYRRYLQTRTQR